MNDLIDFPLTIEHLKQDFPNFDFSRDLQMQTSFNRLEPIISWLEDQGMTIELKEKPLMEKSNIKTYYGVVEGFNSFQTPIYGNKISVWKSAIFLSFNCLENILLTRYL